MSVLGIHAPIAVVEYGAYIVVTGYGYNGVCCQWTFLEFFKEISERLVGILYAFSILCKHIIVHWQNMHMAARVSSLSAKGSRNLPKSLTWL